MTEKILIATVGYPRSGKSTWARATGCPIVNPDSIRLALHGQRFVANAEPFVWAIAQTTVRALFLAGHDRVVLDATNTTRKRRLAWVSEDWTVKWKHIETPAAVCIDRALKASDLEIIPVIERMRAEFEPLLPDEDLFYEDAN